MHLEPFFALNALTQMQLRRLGLLSLQIIPRGDFMGVDWSKDVDQTLVEAKDKNRSILLDFSAVPA
jgi:hypothetical protein